MKLELCDYNKVMTIVISLATIKIVMMKSIQKIKSIIHSVETAVAFNTTMVINQFIDLSICKEDYQYRIVRSKKAIKKNLHLVADVAVKLQCEIKNGDLITKHSKRTLSSGLTSSNEIS